MPSVVAPRGARKTLRPRDKRGSARREAEEHPFNAGAEHPGSPPGSRLVLALCVNSLYEVLRSATSGPMLRRLGIVALAASLASCAPDGGGPEVPPSHAAGSLACRSELSTTHPATLAFWEALETNDVAARSDVLAALVDAHDSHPNETELTLLLGLAELWALADPDSETTLAQQGAMAAASVTHLREARTSCPTDARITAWLGPMLVRMGRVLGNSRMVDEGFSVLDEGIDAYPEFVLFSLAMVLAEEPVDGPDFARALEVMQDNVDVCAPGSDGALDPACRNGARAVHNLEGSAVFMGDVLARGGDVATARAVYERARTSPDYASWGFQGLLEERLARVDEWAALSQDDDPSNDPVIVTSTAHACAICHAR